MMRFFLRLIHQAILTPLVYILEVVVGQVAHGVHQVAHEVAQVDHRAGMYLYYEY